MSHVAQIAEACRQHGEWVQLDDGVRLFADGAALQVVLNFLTGRPDHIDVQEPPTDEYKLLLRRKTFLQAKIDRLTADFNFAKWQFLQQQKFHAGSARFGGSPTCPPAQPDAEEILLGLKSQVDALKAELASINSLVEASPQHQAELKSTKRRAAERTDADNRVLALVGIRLDTAEPAPQEEPDPEWLRDAIAWQQAAIAKLSADAERRNQVHSANRH